MESKKKFKLWSEWLFFLKILFSPTVLVPLIAAIAFLSLPALIEKNGKADEIVISLLGVFASLSASVAGGFISSKWSKFSEMGIFQTKGRSAVRGLKAVSQSIVYLENRIKSICNYHETDEANVNRLLETLFDHCKNLQTQVANSLNEWVDIIPEANEEEHLLNFYVKVIGKKDELEKQISKLQIEKDEIQSSDEQSTQKIEELDSKLAQKEKELKELNYQLTLKNTFSSDRFTSLPTVNEGIWQMGSQIYGTPIQMGTPVKMGIPAEAIYVKEDDSGRLKPIDPGESHVGSTDD